MKKSTMELQKMTSERVVPRKRALAIRDFPPGCGINESERRPLEFIEKSHSDLGKAISHGNDKLVESHSVKTDEINSSKPKEFGGNKTSFVFKPTGKVKYWQPTCTKGGYYQKPKVTTTIGIKRKNFDNVDSNTKKMASNDNDKDKLVNTQPQPVENSKVKSFEPKELVRNKSYLGSKSTRQVKFWDPACEAQKSEVTTSKDSRKEEVRREKIKEAMALFVKFYESLHQMNKLKPKGENISACSVLRQAAGIVKRRLKWMDPVKVLGPVCGVQIGDTFKYREQLMMIGLHCQRQSGIDFDKINGKSLALSIVDAHRYSNDSRSSDKLVYSGQGGLDLFGNKLPPEDQKLIRGNRALKNSMDQKTQVRVIRKVAVHKKEVFVYDGLYIVDDFKREKSAEGKIVFKFHLSREPGQPSLHTMLKW
ncbi:hypothetical protein L1987_62414 [Smallanthus sonchifolius]|uniref:Uncharacterized protein n=1 Tax=Smallanthus sonchifolius TaxID=185202 RepID=A0ACB9CAD8_9ASTR|nr:hypothetical protein L1987_62414 [Smallanthus sonchifolius]